MAKHQRLFPKGDPMSLITQVPQSASAPRREPKAPVWSPLAIANKRRYDAQAEAEAPAQSHAEKVSAQDSEPGVGGRVR